MKRPRPSPRQPQPPAPEARGTGLRFVVPDTAAGQPLLDALAAQTGLSRRAAKALLDARRVFVNRQRTWMARHALQPGDRVEIPDESPARAPARRIPVLYEDDAIVIVDKPSGYVSNGPGSVEEAIRTQLNDPELRCVHRLDRDTTGCLLLARTPAHAETLIAAFKDRCVGKGYRAIVLGAVEPREQTITRPIDGQEAVTRLRVLDANRDASHLALRIDSGRTHQIRKHLTGLRHPLVGDRQYGTRGRATDKSMRVGRQMLHAFQLEVPHPETGRTVRARAPLPHDFRKCLKLFRLT